jgi:TRAP transporter 4TM/12TM fusion protein
MSDVQSTGPVTSLSLPEVVKTAVALGLFFVSLYDILVSDLDDVVIRGVFLGFALLYSFAFYAGGSAKRSAFAFWMDILAGLVGLAVCFYIVFDFENVFSRAGDINTTDYIVAALAIVLVLEATRRTAGLALPLLSLIFLLYPLWYGPWMPGILKTGVYSLQRVLTLQFLSSEGILGSALGVTIEFVYLFVIYGAVLNRTGAIEFMDELSRALCGASRGGSGKIATVSSLFMGLASGSAVANVVSQGVFTIPMMRREGFSPSKAAAIEAASSTGGQIMPPVMGAAAFLMAEYTRTPYSQIIIYAIVPGLLFYFAIWSAVHWEAVRIGMKGLPRDQLPPVGKVMREGGLHFISILVIVGMMGVGYSMANTVLVAVVVALICALIHKKSRAQVTLSNLIGALREGFQDSISLLTSAACAGIIIGVVVQTAFGLKISALVIDASMGQLWIALLLCGLVCLILGMGLPTQIIYLTLAVLVAPAIVKMGVTVAGAHLFIIYFGMMSMVTPPVCFAAFAAAGIAGAKLMETGWESCKISIAGLVVPFYFAYHPGVLLIGDWPGIFEGVFRALIGTYMAGVGIGLFVFSEKDYSAPLPRVLHYLRMALGALATVLLCAPGVTPLLAGLACSLAAAMMGPLLRRRAPQAV